jgi:hypothetical protein
VTGDSLPRGVQQFRMLHLVARDPAMHRGDVAVMGALLDMLNWRDGYAHPALDTIAQRAALSRSATAEALKRLTTAGYVRVLLKGSGRRANRYTPAFDLIDTEPHSSPVERTTTGDASSPAERTATPIPSSPVQSRSSPVEGSVAVRSKPVAVRSEGRSSPVDRTLTHEPMNPLNEPTDRPVPASSGDGIGPCEPGAESSSPSPSSVDAAAAADPASASEASADAEGPSNTAQEESAPMSPALADELRTLTARDALLKARLRHAMGSSALDAVLAGDLPVLDAVRAAALREVLHR